MDKVMFVVETDCQNKYTELDVLQKFQELDADITAFRITRHKQGEYVAMQERMAELEKLQRDNKFLWVLLRDEFINWHNKNHTDAALLRDCKNEKCLLAVEILNTYQPHCDQCDRRRNCCEDKPLQAQKRRTLGVVAS